MGELADILRNGAEKLGISLENQQVNMFMEYLYLLKEWNKKVNVTAITGDKEIIIKHFLDSLTCAATGYLADGDKAIDIGTGGGFPGLPLKIVFPGLKITLVDALRKRINFLSNVVKNLELEGVDLVHGRAENLGVKDGFREEFRFCFSRAVAHLAVLSEYCIPFLKVGGYFFALKGPSYREELEDSKGAIKVLGGELREIKEFVLPYTDIHHYILIVEKIKATPSKYPRKAGKPEKNPIK